MASQKLSALTAVTSTADESLIYVANTTDSGSSYAGRKITKSNLLSGYATESYVTTQISNLIDGAPDALNTLNEIAAAINDDADIATTLTALSTANETHIDNMATLTGVAKDSTNLGTFTGSTIADSQTVKAALQALETAVEAAGSASTLTAVSADVVDLRTSQGLLMKMRTWVLSQAPLSLTTSQLKLLSNHWRLLLRPREPPTLATTSTPSWPLRLLRQSPLPTTSSWWTSPMDLSRSSTSPSWRSIR